MDKYYVNNNPQPTGEHEVHKENCDHFPGDYKYLGEYSKCQGAIEKKFMKMWMAATGVVGSAIPDK